jgi:hypothetical protein
MGWFSGLFGGGSDSGGSFTYTAEEARRDGHEAARADNAASFDTRGDSEAVEARYRLDGIERDYNNGERF